MLKKAIELDPEFAPAHAHLGRLYYTQLNWESTVESFSTAFELGSRMKSISTSWAWRIHTLTIVPMELSGLRRRWS